MYLYVCVFMSLPSYSSCGSSGGAFASIPFLGTSASLLLLRRGRRWPYLFGGISAYVLLYPYVCLVYSRYECRDGYIDLCVYSLAYHEFPKLCFIVGTAEVCHGKPRALVIFVRTVATRQRHFLQPSGLTPLICCVCLALGLSPPLLCLRSGCFPSQHIHENGGSWHLPLSEEVWAIGLDQKHVVGLPRA